MTPRALASIVLATGLLAGCGGSSGTPGRAATQAATPRSTPAPPAGARDPFEIPADVPLKATGPADPARVKVIRAWSAALRDGDVAGASAQWAVPAKVQNGSPVLRLSSAAEVRIFNGALTCGSVVTSTGGASGGFTIVKVRLTRRRGADCGSGAGRSARTAILVRGGRIVAWYRLPDDPSAPGLPPPPTGDGDPQASQTV
ncbi:MAG TPA: hypothetical protein VHZ31_07590 [Solirubrobacteraceae bacterium]|jgi:hypothetical protein|nr:hypothetical protein [Solirubrobacteraceae bacterium]